MATNHSGDLAANGLKAERFTVSLSDNTAATICSIPTGKLCMGVVIMDFIGQSASTIESYAVSMTSSTVTLTPQVTSNLAGTAEVLVLFKK